MAPQKIRRNVHMVLLSYGLIVLCCLAAQSLRGADAAAVMSVDLGSEWMKVGVVSPGVPMEIVLNRESKRKTPSILAFRDGVRSFGEDAMIVGIREPAAAYAYLLDLLGKTIDNPIVDLYRKRFPYYNIVADPERKTVIFKKNDEEQFSVEELVAQMLTKAKEYTEETTGQIITECVLTVPGYFGQAEREALLAAARLANLKVLQLINDYTAVALHYGVFNHAHINETAQYFVFYDMGAYSTTASLVSYQLVKDKQTKETYPMVQVLGVGYDRTLGGLEIQLRLRDHLAEAFNALKKTKTDVRKSPRALAKLFKEAGRLKNVLSANNDHYAQIENLLEDHDFKLQVTREELEQMCENLWPRVTKPLEQALAAAHLTMDSVSQLILFGGGTRVPKIQELIRDAIDKQPSKSLNADEAAALGAVYKAADLATGFKVKKFLVKDAVIYPIHVTFARAVSEEDTSNAKPVKRVLFPYMSPYPQKKVITFNKHTQDFNFFLTYGDLEQHLPKEEVTFLGERNISKVELQGVQDLLEQHKADVVESKGIKAFFVMDDSGLVRCTNVEYVFDKQQTENYVEDEGTLAKLGSTISKLFTKSQENDNKNTEENNTEQEHKSSEEQKDEKEKSENSSESAQNETVGEQQPSKQDKNETLKLVTVKEPVKYNVNIAYSQILTEEPYEKIAEKLAAINKVEEERARLQSSFNSLEAHVIDTQQKLGEQEYSSCLTEKEKKKILEECETISNWLYEDIENPTPEIYEEKLQKLKKLTNVYLARHWEHEERPDALKALEGMIDGAQKFLATAKNLTSENNPDKDVFTQVEINVLSKTINDTIEWQRTEIAAQKKLKRHEDVRLLVKHITDKMAVLDREVKYLVNKIKLWKPKPTPKKETQDKKTNDKKSEKNVEGDEDAGSDNETAGDIQIEETENTEQTTNTTNEGETKKSDTATPRSDL